MLADIEIFRAAPIYLKQRRIIADSKKPEEEKTAIIAARYPSGEIVQLTPEEVAEEQSNVDYTIRQMNDYLIKVLQLDQSYLMRDIASVHQFAGFQDHIFALHNDFSECELVVGSVSQILGAKAEAHKTLQPFAAEDTPNELRLTQYGSAARQAVLNTTTDAPEFNNFGQYQKQEQAKPKEADAQEQANVDPGIVIRGR